MFRRWYRWFLARFRFDLQVVCEESANKGLGNDFHDFPDDEFGFPDHFRVLTCKRCRKTFTI